MINEASDVELNTFSKINVFIKNGSVCKKIAPVLSVLNQTLRDDQRSVMISFVKRAAGSETENEKINQERTRKVKVFCETLLNVLYQNAHANGGVNYGLMALADKHAQSSNFIKTLNFCSEAFFLSDDFKGFFNNHPIFLNVIYQLLDNLLLDSDAVTNDLIERKMYLSVLHPWSNSNND
jgi:hypothetical protein